MLQLWIFGMLSVAKSRSAGTSKVKIYTKTGDKGLTSLYGGIRISKADPKVDAYGIIDELNSTLGVFLSRLVKKKDISPLLQIIQKDLFSIGAHLAGSKISLDFIQLRVTDMEHLIDTLDSHLPELKNFILPGGSPEASLAHFARTVCRRAERAIVKIKKETDFPDSKIIIYLNRLSDLMFVIARELNYRRKHNESIWRSLS